MQVFRSFMQTQLLFTRFLNHAFAPQVNWLLGLFHVTPAYANAPITNAVSMEFLVFMVLLLYFIAVRLSLSVEKPNGVQHLAEITNEFVSEQSEQIIGHGYERFVTYLTVIGLFILIMNLVGLVPGLESPTANVSVPLGFAVITFIYYHYQGVRSNGASYIKQFIGPVWWMSWLLLPVEIISHFARILSLTVRLYANMFAGDLLTLVFFSMVPIGVPLIFLGLHLGVAVIQAYVFMLLAAIYLSLAVAHEH
jgi:F-type H+-transporting ATPase subunit a